MAGAGDPRLAFLFPHRRRDLHFARSDAASEIGPVRPVARSTFLHLKRRTLLWPTLPPIIEARRRNVGMPQPLLHLGNVGVVRQGIRRGRGPQGMHAEAVHIGGNAQV
jgi:hypothetical protein